MFFRLSEEVTSTQVEVQALLDKKNPLPDADLNLLAEVGAGSPETAQGAALRRLVVDLDDLFVQLRWHVGQALLIWRAFPRLWSPTTKADELTSRFGMVNKARLLLRPFIMEQSCVFYHDLEERRPGGGTIGGWVLHMMVDSAVDRSVAILDRLARLSALAAGVKFANDKVYFRSGKLKVIRRTIGAELGDPLVALAEGEAVQFLISYRDGLSHTIRPASWVSGTPAADSWVDDTGVEQRAQDPHWGANELVSIALLALDVTSQALTPVVAICRRFAPAADEEAKG